MSTTIYNNNHSKSTTNIDSQSTEEQEAISSLSTEIISITSKLNNLNAELADMKIAINKLKKEITTLEAKKAEAVAMLKQLQASNK
ncbi:hypothetical protein [uncultured Catenibacterium sp.]|uniref:hypothetical protein n=1 Tax=uncultured Catenibacterium sp. TaxID=286142 RepID=UPI0025858F2C|nr:hypothetical protein [uncultured Catenibacterium sp.]